MDKPHYEVVAAIIKKDHKILCCQRGNKKECPFKWEFPGGKIEKGETKEQALHREIKEELNCSININEFFMTIHHEYESFKITMHIYLCTLKNKDPELIEHNDCMWVNKEEIVKLDFVEADYQFINLLKF